jgi:hypothetical protein
MSAATDNRTLCRLQIGDTADCKSALPSVQAGSLPYLELEFLVDRERVASNMRPVSFRKLY